MLVVGSGNRPGVFDWFGHATTGFHPFYEPRSGLVLLRCTEAAAREYLLRASCYMAPPELQNADR
jgi:hypothetical protein